jgi:hypothetical protein
VCHLFQSSRGLEIVVVLREGLRLSTSVAEFRGYVVRALQDIDKDVDNIEERCRSCGKTIQDLSAGLSTLSAKTKLMIVVIGLTGGILGNLIVTLIVLLFRHVGTG